jgi:ligand-binding sensor domain-containing protein/signal transduction histidine kinase
VYFRRANISKVHLARFLLLFLQLSAICLGQRLSIQAYSAKDGLAHDHINRIRVDSRGVLWFCTDEGLSQFDGSRFTTYTTEHGLPHPHVNDLLETRSGVYWIATDAGVARFHPKGSAGRFFEALKHDGNERSRMVNILLEQPDGSIWCGTSDGLYRLERQAGAFPMRPENVGFPERFHDGSQVNTLLLDRSSVLWIGAGSGVYRREDAAWRRYSTSQGLPGNFINVLSQDHEGRIWAGTRNNGLCRLVSQPKPHQPIADRVITVKDGLPHYDVRAIHHDSAGRFWIATVGGLSELGPPMANHTRAHGLTEDRIYALQEDSQGNLWIGTNHGGVMRLARDGMVTYSESNGLKLGSFNSVFETASGELCIYSGENHWRVINKFDGKRFNTISIPLPKRAIGFGYSWYQTILQDHLGFFWLPTMRGVYRFPPVKHLGELARRGPEELSPGMGVSKLRVPVPHLYEDRRGDLWFTVVPDETNPDARGLYRWERASGTIHEQPVRHAPVTAFMEDAHDNLWMGLYGEVAGLMRYRSGRFERFGGDEGLPAALIHGFHHDLSGRVWVATGRGLVRIDNPSDNRLRFTVFTTANGLSSNEIWCLTEDHLGRIYAGTGRGLDRLEPATGRVRHFSVSEGLAPGNVRAAYRDRQGHLWFVTHLGASRLIPTPAESSAGTPIRVTEIRVRGQAVPVSQLGESEINLKNLRPDENQLEIAYSGVNFTGGAPLRYQYRLNSPDGEWSPATDQRTIVFGRLSSGAYTFEVRAVDGQGGISPKPASVRFQILPPLWQRWWFLSLLATLVILGIYAIHRARLHRELAMERVRSRIATDLHDDIGASLSQIAVLSEVVRWRVDARDAAVAGPLARIGDISRETVDSMSDIVWAINPRHDRLSDLIGRMRRFAQDLLSAGKIQFELEVRGSADVPLNADARRDVFLIFKESLHNALRHSECNAIRVDVDVQSRWLKLRVADNGRGFSVGQEPNKGEGLASMRRRAAKLGASITIAATEGTGTSIELALPLLKRHHISM